MNMTIHNSIPYSASFTSVNLHSVGAGRLSKVCHPLVVHGSWVKRHKLWDVSRHVLGVVIYHAYGDSTIFCYLPFSILIHVISYAPLDQSTLGEPF